MRRRSWSLKKLQQKRGQLYLGKTLPTLAMCGVVHAEARGGARFSRWAGRGRGRAAAPCAASAPRGGPAPPSPWEQPRRPGSRSARLPRSPRFQGRVGWAEPGTPPRRGQERTRCGSRKTARLPGAGSRSRFRPGARGNVSHERDVDAVPRAAAAVYGAPGGCGPGRRAAHRVRLRAVPARGAGAADGALRAYPARPLQPHARLVLDRPQGGARARAVRLRAGLSCAAPLAGPRRGLSRRADLTRGAARPGPRSGSCPASPQPEWGGHEKSKPSPLRPLPSSLLARPEPHFVPLSCLVPPLRPQRVGVSLLLSCRLAA